MIYAIPGTLSEIMDRLVRNERSFKKDHIM